MFRNMQCGNQPPHQKYISPRRKPIMRSTLVTLIILEGMVFYSNTKADVSKKPEKKKPARASSAKTEYICFQQNSALTIDQKVKDATQMFT